MVKTVFKRVEYKYVISKQQYEKIMQLLQDKMVLDDYCQNNQPYNIYNIYFDNEYNDVIRHSTSKPYYKEKLRLRSYQLSDEKAKVFLELKKKVDKVVSKRRVIMTFLDAMNFLKTGQYGYEYAEKAIILEEIKNHIKKFKVIPKVFIAYDRMAFFGKEDSEFRVSFDRDIVSRRTNLTFTNRNFERTLLSNNQCLMEVKTNGAMPIWFSKILSELGIFKSSFSKYGNEFDLKIKEENKRVFSYVSLQKPSVYTMDTMYRGERYV